LSLIPPLSQHEIGMIASYRKTAANDRDFVTCTLAEAARYLRLPAATPP